MDATARFASATGSPSTFVPRPPPSRLPYGRSPTGCRHLTGANWDFGKSKACAASLARLNARPGPANFFNAGAQTAADGFSASVQRFPAGRDPARPFASGRHASPHLRILHDQATAFGQPLAQVSIGLSSTGRWWG